MQIAEKLAQHPLSCSTWKLWFFLSLEQRLYTFR